jgi:hypothetical protein
VILFDPIFQGMAISLLFGVLVSTVLTLVVIPLGCISARAVFCPVTEGPNSCRPAVAPGAGGGVTMLASRVGRLLLLVANWLGLWINRAIEFFFTMVVTLVYALMAYWENRRSIAPSAPLSSSAESKPEQPVVVAEPETTELKSRVDRSAVTPNEQSSADQNDVQGEAKADRAEVASTSAKKAASKKTLTSKKKAVVKKTAAPKKKAVTKKKAVVKKKLSLKQPSAEVEGSNEPSSKPPSVAIKKGRSGAGTARRGIRLKKNLDDDNEL